MIKARASGSKVYLYFMKKGRQARHRIPQNSCGSLVILDVARCCLCLFTLYINIKIGKNSC